MIPFYWINLDDSVDRRNKMIKQFKEHKLPNRRVQAIRHQRGGIGCALSHVKAIHTAWAEENDMAIICEDDIDLSKGKRIYELINKILLSMPNEIRNSWEIVQLTYTDPSFSTALANYLEEKQYKPGNKLIKGYLMSTVAYLINRKGMNKFVNTMTKPDDTDMSRYILNVDLSHPMAICEELTYHYVNSYFSLFPLVTHVDTISTISQDISYTSVHDKNKANMVKMLTNLKDEQYELEMPRLVEFARNCHWFADYLDKATETVKSIFDMK